MKTKLTQILELCESNIMAQLKQMKSLVHQFDCLQGDQQLKIEKAIRRLQSFFLYNPKIECNFQHTKARHLHLDNQLNQIDLKTMFQQIGTDQDLQQKYFENCHLINRNSHLKNINNSGIKILALSDNLYIGEIYNEQFHGKGLAIGENQIIDGYFYEGELQEGLSLYYDVDDNIVCEIGVNSEEREQKVEIENKKKIKLFEQYLTTIQQYIQKNASIEIISLISLYNQDLQQKIDHMKFQQRLKNLEMIQKDDYCGFVKQQKKECFGYYQDKQEVFYGFWKKDVFRKGFKLNLITKQAHVFDTTLKILQK